MYIYIYILYLSTLSRLGVLERYVRQLARRAGRRIRGLIIGNNSNSSNNNNNNIDINMINNNNNPGGRLGPHRYRG